MSKISPAEYKANSSLLGFVEAPLIFERSSESLLFACLPDFFRKRVQRYDISANWQNNFPTFFIKHATFFRQRPYTHLKRGWQRAQTKTTLCKPNEKKRYILFLFFQNNYNVFIICDIISTTSKSAGNHLTLSSSSFVSHRAASCSFRRKVSASSEQR